MTTGEPAEPHMGPHDEGNGPREANEQGRHTEVGADSTADGGVAPEGPGQHPTGSGGAATDEAKQIEAMRRRDPVSARLGIRLWHVGPGTALTRMAVREDMVDEQGICAAAYLFMLAECTFRLGCSTRGRQMATAVCDIHFFRPVRLGEQLLGTAMEKVTTSGTSVCDVEIQRMADNVTVALLRGQARGAAGIAATLPGPSSSAPD